MPDNFPLLELVNNLNQSGRFTQSQFERLNAWYSPAHMEPHLRALVEQSPAEQIDSVQRLFTGSSEPTVDTYEAEYPDPEPEPLSVLTPNGSLGVGTGVASDVGFVIDVGTGVASDVGVVIGTSDPWPSSDTVATIPEPSPPSVLTPTAPTSRGMMEDNAPGAGGVSDLGAVVEPSGATGTYETYYSPSAKVARDARETEDRAAGFDVFDAIDDATGGVARGVDVFVNEELGGQPGQTISARSYGTAVGDVLDYVAPGHTGSALVSYQIQSNTLPCIPKSYEAEIAKHYRKTKKCSW